MASLTQWFPSSVLRRAFKLRDIHAYLGTTAFVLTAITIALGINDALHQGSCAYVVTVDDTQMQNPALNYSVIPLACKLANWCGLLVLLVCGLVIASMQLRSEIAKAENARQHAWDDNSIDNNPSANSTFSSEPTPTHEMIKRSTLLPTFNNPMDKVTTNKDENI
jgi:hypothetical protein